MPACESGDQGNGREEPEHNACYRVAYSPGMLVADLHLFLDLTPDVPDPARRLAEQLSRIVAAATAGDAGTAWETALSCQRRPNHRRCPGRMIVIRTEPTEPIRWQCNVCADSGVISNWADSPYDLRRRGLAVAPAAQEIVLSSEAAAALRDLQLLEPDSERLVYRMRAHGDDAVRSVTDEDLEMLIGAVAAEANHESNRRRQRRLDAALEALESAAWSSG
jgi:hypothetical protein